ncbi:uncharacterized protein DS421_6g182760 [Arachis hypogaea]|nr:uncharacterized protein DS421_6g182760 [Arachis hypogaea]
MQGDGRNYGQASQNYPPQQNYGQASQNHSQQETFFRICLEEIQEHIMYGRRVEATKLLRKVEGFLLQGTPLHVDISLPQLVQFRVIAFQLFRCHTKLRNRHDVKRIWEACKAIAPSEPPSLFKAALKSFVRLKKLNEAKEVCDLFPKSFPRSSYSTPIDVSCLYISR